MRHDIIKGMKWLSFTNSKRIADYAVILYSRERVPKLYGLRFCDTFSSAIAAVI